MKIRIFAIRAATLTFVAIVGLAIGMYLAPEAKAVHKCGQLLGSCLPHGIKTPVVKIQKPIKIEAARPVIKVVPVRPAVLKCYKTIWKYGQWITIKPLREVPCK